MTTLKRNPPPAPSPTRKRATTTKRSLPAAPEKPKLKSEIVSRVELGDNREVRVSRIPTGLSEDLIRVGINLLPNGETMSGAVFPQSYLRRVIAAMEEAVT
jgi:hypothetical protein